MHPSHGEARPREFVPVLFLRDLKAAARKGQFPLVESLLAGYRERSGQDACYAEFVSWVARSAASKGFQAEARRYAATAYELAAGKLEAELAPVDSPLTVAMGAAIELESGWLLEKDGAPAAIAYLSRELDRFASQPLRIRIRKNLHLLALAGQTAPALDWTPLAGTSAGSAAVFDEPCLIFFWAHWCSDSRNQARILGGLPRAILDRIRLVAPTRLFGYITKGNAAEADIELARIQEVLPLDYSVFRSCPIPLPAGNFDLYGASTIPTLVGVRPGGVVSFFHAGLLGAEPLETRLLATIEG